MERFIMDNGITRVRMAEAGKYSMMDLCMKAIGRIASLMVVAGRYFQMGKFMKDSGLRGNFKGRAFSSERMALHIQGNG